MCMIDGCDQWTFTHYKTVKARKAHECSECEREIRPGETYERFKGLIDGRWSLYTTCEHCQAARSWLEKVCGGWLFQGVLIELEEHWDADWSYRSVWLGRAILTLRRRHKKPDGTLRKPLEPFTPPKSLAH